MILTSDGKEYVFLVFDYDGYECSNFVGVFSAQQEAETVAEAIRVLNRKFHAEHLKGSEWVGSVAVVMKAIGDYDLPTDAWVAKNEPVPESPAS